MFRHAAIALVAVFLLAGATASAQDIQISLQADADAVVVGDSLNVEISVEGAGVRSPNVEMDDPPQFEIEGRSQGQQVSIVGGRTSMSRTLNLRYRAVKSGRAKFGPARVRYKGRVYQSNAVDVDVADSAAAAPSGPAPTEAAGKNAFLDVELTATEAYPGQEVGAAYFFYTSLNVRQAEAVSEPSFPGAIPHKLAGGGKLNFIGTRVGGESYLVSPLVRYVLYPVAPGEVTVDEFRMAALVDRPNKRRRGDVFDSFFATSAQRVDLASPRKIIKVKPLPAEGRPADFSGNVGVFTMSASLDKTSVDVGDAVTLSIVVEGKGNTETIAPPAVDVADGLKTFSQSSRDESVAAFDTMKSRRVFETIIVPEKSGVYDIGPFDMPVFDPDEEEYVRVTAPAVRFEAAPGSGPTMAAKNGGAKSAIALSGKDIRTVKRDADRLEETPRPVGRDPFLWLVIFAGPLGFAVRLWQVRTRERLASDVTLARRVKAGKEARRRLAEARKLVDGDAARFGAELYAALIGFVADQLGIEAPSLTANRARDGLAARGVPAEQLDALLDSLKRCDGLRYGGFSPPRAEREALLQKAGNFIDRVHRVLQKGGAK